MRIIAVIEADFSRGALGTVSRLDHDLAGETALRRTLRRILACGRVAGVHLCVHVSQEAQAREAATGLDVVVETHDSGPPLFRDRVASGRKWSLDSWRGGLAGATVFDESMNPWLLDALARREGVDAVVSVPPAAALIDPALLGQVIAHFEEVHEDVRMAFTQSPPGLSAAVYLTPLLADLVKAAQGPGSAFAYHPEAPSRDMVMQRCFHPTDAVVMHATGRCIADTQRAVDRIASILAEAGSDGGTLDAPAVSRWLTDHRYGDAGGLPAEVEIELTTDDPLPRSTLRPRGAAVPRRGPMDINLLGRLVDELATCDDMRIVLGGFGDPLMHPDWPTVVGKCRSAGVFGLAVRTPGVQLDDAAVHTLMDNRVDVLNILLDAATSQTYQRVHQADHFDCVVANVDRVRAAYQQRKQLRPLVVCEMVKTRSTLHEMEAFYDQWMRRTGSAVLTGPSAYAGQWQDLAAINMAPPTRFPCQRVFSRLMVLADGAVVACDQDFKGAHAVGSLRDSTVGELWRSSAMEAIRRSHRGGLHDGMALCPACQEWHRP